VCSLLPGCVVMMIGALRRPPKSVGGKIGLNPSCHTFTRL
jgi:hypothetical protein